MAFSPPLKFSAKAHIKSREEYNRLYKQSLEEPDKFWSRAAEDFYWHKKWTLPICKYNFDTRRGRVFAEWFPSAETNLCYNALDRHVETGHGSQIAFYWEGNAPEYSTSFTYQQVKDAVCRLANFLKKRGVKKGDDVTIYLPMIAELPIAMLACARIGAVHSVVFAGFSAKSLANRINDSGAKILLTASGVMRGSKFIDLKRIVDDAVSQVDHEITTCLVFDHKTAVERSNVPWTSSRIFGGKIPSHKNPKNVLSNGYSAKIHPSNSTPAVLQEIQRAFYTPQAVTCWDLHSHSNMFLITTKATSSGARPIVDGLQVILTLLTVLCSIEQRKSSSKAFQHIQHAVAVGKSSIVTKSINSTPLRQQFVL